MDRMFLKKYEVVMADREPLFVGIELSKDKSGTAHFCLYMRDKSIPVAERVVAVGSGFSAVIGFAEFWRKVFRPDGWIIDTTGISGALADKLQEKFNLRIIPDEET